jgi:hypothetical protein
MHGFVVSMLFDLSRQISNEKTCQNISAISSCSVFSLKPKFTVFFQKYTLFIESVYCKHCATVIYAYFGIHYDLNQYYHLWATVKHAFITVSKRFFSMSLSIITFCFAIITFVGVKHIVLHAKISYFSYGRIYTDKIAIESGMTDL